MTWAFSIWTSFRAWQESFPPWKERIFYALLAAYLAVGVDIVL